MLGILWYTLTVGLSIFGAGWLMNILAWFFSESSPPPEFEIQTFSLMGQGYGTAQWITHITYFLILASAIFLIFDSFLSAGPIGAIFHIAAVLSANIIGMILSFAVIITLLQALPVAAAVIIVVIGIFTASYRTIYIYM